MKKLLLIDGSNLIFRAYFATEKQAIKTLDNKPANAIHSLIGMINKLIIEIDPTHIFIALDDKGPTFRHEMYEEYKSKRSDTPENLRTQFSMVQDLYDAMDIKYFSTPGYEADDIIASYATQAMNQDFNVFIVSGDKDLLQLVDDKVTVITPKIGFSKQVNYTPSIFEEKYGFSTNRFTEFKALVGDSSDNIIGVSKVGVKTATKYIQKYKNYDEIIDAANSNEIKGVVGENLKNSKILLDNNMKLVELVTDLSLELPLDELIHENFISHKFIDYLKKCGFSKLVSDYSSKLPDFERKELVESFTIITDFTKDKHTCEINYIYTQSLKSNYHESECLGIGLYNDKGLFYLDYKKINEEFIDFIYDDSEKVCFDSKCLIGLLKLEKINNLTFDVRMALSLIRSENFKREFYALASMYEIDYISTNEEVYKKKANPIRPINSILHKDITSKAHALKKMHIEISNELETFNLHEVYYTIELPLINVLAQMELDGILIDVDTLSKLSNKYENEISQIQSKLNNYTDVNIDSPKQLSELLFVEWNLPTKSIKKTTSGFSTDVASLDNLYNMLNIEKNEYKMEIEFIILLKEYRKLKKINSVYIDGLRKFIVNQKIHPIYNQLQVETGRLSVSEPNIQNIPIRSNDGKIIRSLFNAPEGYVVCAIDYSQVELRIIAHMANETHMINDFKSNLDIHESTAKKIFHTNVVTKEQRSKAKSINFGIIYGMSKYGLASQLNIDVDEAQSFIDKYLENYPNISKFINETIIDATENGYVSTLFNRRRYIDNINTNNKNDLKAAHRVAINTPIQGTAADIIKKAMVSINEFLLKSVYDCKMVMQIHDELVFYVKQDELEVIDKLVLIMQSVVDFEIILLAESAYGKNWLETK